MITLQNLTRKEKLLVGVLMPTAVLTLVGGIYFVWVTSSPPMPKTAEDALALLDSKRYTRLPEQQRYPYIKKSEELIKAMSEDDRRALFKRLGQRAKDDSAFRYQMMQAQTDRLMGMAREWAGADEFHRQALIDQAIGAMELARQRGQERRQEKPKEPDDKKAGDSAEDKAAATTARQKGMAEFQSFVHEQIEAGNPQNQAYVAEFFKALIGRRKQLGMPDLPPPRKRGRE